MSNVTHTGTTPEIAAQLAVQFWNELLGSVETLLGIADTYGTRTLVDLMYLQNAIYMGRHIDHAPEVSSILDVVDLLPSKTTWKKYIRNLP